MPAIEDIQAHFKEAESVHPRNALSDVEGIPAMNEQCVSHIAEFVVDVARTIPLGPLFIGRKIPFKELPEPEKNDFRTTRKHLQLVRSVLDVVHDGDQTILDNVTKKAGKVKDNPRKRSKSRNLQSALSGVSHKSNADALLWGVNGSVTTKPIDEVKDAINARFASIDDIADVSKKRKCKTSLVHDARRSIRDLSKLVGVQTLIDNETKGPTWSLFVVLRALEHELGQQCDKPQVKKHKNMKLKEDTVYLAQALRYVLNS